VAGSFLASRYTATGQAASQSFGAVSRSSLAVDRAPRGLVTPKVSLVFGFLVGTAGCYAGMTASGGTEGVGQAATRGVVGSTFLVLLSNVVLVKFIQVVSA
jgi:ABC-type transporter Mla maintaining outer membrane lipid asymmetry permease subunit MlaE